jgi:hypothetical protein
LAAIDIVLFCSDLRMLYCLCLFDKHAHPPVQPEAKSLKLYITINRCGQNRRSIC